MSAVWMLGYPAPGHVNPTLPIVAELVRRGEHVTYYATEPFRQKVEHTGATFRSYGDHSLFERSLGVGGMIGGMAALLETADAILPALDEAVRRDQPAYLLMEAHAVWGNLLAQARDVPAVTLCAMFAINREVISPSQLLQHLYGTATPGQLMEALLALTVYFERARGFQRRSRLQCPGLVDYLGNRQGLNIVLTSREFQVRGDVLDESYRFIGASMADDLGDEDLPFERQPTVPLIFVSMGTMYNDEAEFYRQCFAAFGDRPCQVVMAVGHRVDRSQLPEPPANVVVRDYVPQVAVLKVADLFVTHGGINSAHEAMLAGVPMIVLPQAADHHVVAGRIADVGAGVVLERSQVTVGDLRALADRVLGSGTFKERSRAAGESLRAAGGYRLATDVIMNYVRPEGTV